MVFFQTYASSWAFFEIQHFFFLFFHYGPSAFFMTLKKRMIIKFQLVYQFTRLICPVKTKPLQTYQMVFVRTVQQVQSPS